MHLLFLTLLVLRFLLDLTPWCSPSHATVLISPVPTPAQTLVLIRASVRLPRPIAVCLDAVSLNLPDRHQDRPRSSGPTRTDLFRHTEFPLSAPSLKQMQDRIGDLQRELAHLIRAAKTAETARVSHQ